MLRRTEASKVGSSNGHKPMGGQGAAKLHTQDKYKNVNKMFSGLQCGFHDNKTIGLLFTAVVLSVAEQVAEDGRDGGRTLRQPNVLNESEQSEYAAEADDAACAGCCEELLSRARCCSSVLLLLAGAHAYIGHRKHSGLMVCCEHCIRPS